MSRGPEVADVFNKHGYDYRQSNRMPLRHLRVMRAIEFCRTAVLGGHKDRCDDCGHLEISYNSCRNRHCPKCQTLTKQKWIEARERELLPIEYFHVVFTIPADLRAIVAMNQGVMYDILFKAVSETLIELSANPKHLGAKVGFLCILHTWGQNLMDHPHIHCVVTGGGLSINQEHWVSCRKGFFLPVRVMSSLFRGKFLAYIKSAFKAQNLIFPGGIAHYNESGVFEILRRKLYHRKWVVYSKPPFGGSEGVLRYLGRYTHRVAISNSRIVRLQDGSVSFKWRDYADGDKLKTMTLGADEFIRRFLLHVLPERYVRIRHYGLLANRNRRDNVALCNKLLGSINSTTPKKEDTESWQELLLRLSGRDVCCCPVCGKGEMVTVETLPSYRCNSPPVSCP